MVFHSVGRGHIFHKWSLNNWLSIWKKIKLDAYVMPNAKINSRWIKDLCIKIKTMKTIQNSLCTILEAGETVSPVLGTQTH